MARKLRLEFPGACYHVINRGNYRRSIFEMKGAAGAFERCLFETAERFRWRIHAFVIMRNHFHLAVETPQPNLSLGMKWLQGTWAARFNRFRGEKGRPFQGRYRAQHVEPGRVLAQVAHYIHLNPLKAGLVETGAPASFRHGSLHWFGQRGRPRCLEAATVLAESGGLRDTTAGWRCYSDYLVALSQEHPAERRELFAQLARGWMVGSEEYRRALRKDFAAQAVALKRIQLLGGAGREDINAELWEDALQVAARTLRIKLENLPEQKSAAAKVMLAALLKATTSVSNGWLARRLKMGEPASVSQYVRRFRQKSIDRIPAFQKALSRVKT